MRRVNSIATLEKFEGWEGFEKSEQTFIRSEHELALQSRQNELRSSLEFGQHLRNLRDKLEPKRMWMKYLLAYFRMSVPTAYRYINASELAEKRLTPKIIDMAIEHGYSIPINKLRTIRPPKSDDTETVIKFLDRVSSRPARVASIEVTPEAAVRKILNETKLAFEKLPPNGRTRQAALNKLVGMLLTQFGYTHEVTFAPVDIAEEFKVYRGRPRLTPRTEEEVA